MTRQILECTTLQRQWTGTSKARSRPPTSCGQCSVFISCAA